MKTPTLSALALFTLVAAAPLLRAQSNLEDISTTPVPAAAEAAALDPEKEPSKKSQDSKGIAFLPPKSGIRQELSLDYGYAAGSDLKKSGASGSLQEQSSHFAYNLTVPLDAKWTTRFGIAESRIDFGRPGGSPLPQNLQTTTLSLGAQYKIDDHWAAFGAIAPRLSLIDGWDRINSQEVQFGGAVGAVYIVNRDLVFTMGLGINPGNEDLPVMPLVGVHWVFAKDWTLDLGIPRTALSYQILPKLKLIPVMVGFDGGTFHTSKTYGNAFGQPGLNDKKLQYTEVRVGSGASYAFLPNLSLDLTGGVIAYRKFDFKDGGYSPQADPAPYAQIGLKLGF
ncbi:hypothetical protein SAMN05444156_0117 [Verrucomicrobium sp. GAS474]|uniref:DUF6268 family outer membrane beta-barrel protein n=1 Tax=Verrucomicrobium sp. GAS474 TaxID=1882831 RepID=UPI00087C2412|nr:DUF6268 family outer membrane beta-barrel protein [Verrucomicrobium sp. GAS474]SDT86068.1 hypothetical protein SAMN05444156_0117 [Verrucomicrobium sp. GAS474]